MLRKISAGFAGGACGALVDSFNIWILGKAGVTAMLGIGLRPAMTASWLYPRLVWGGLFGLLFLLPFSKGHVINKGLLLSLIPSAIMLLVVFPDMGKGMFGLGYGALTPVLVVLLNFVWGMVAGLWYKQAS